MASKRKPKAKAKKAQVKESDDRMTVLMQLRDLTQRTGILYEDQVQQLKIWPYVAFDLKEHTIYPDNEDRSLAFDLVFKKAPPKRADKKCSALKNWIQKLLGEEWLVVLKVDGKVWYRGERSKPWVRQQNDEVVVPKRWSDRLRFK